ncbi:RNA polymerase sigma factor [Paenibacillus assamensis]|uniref:RNA polymerase sigma factor n=1 Tax=Paenibacillus assamensis TaxID=311244 RepID=UPI00041B1152|nr:RNA polymerase sigma factor [Paenibacillus assamensis]
MTDEQLIAAMAAGDEAAFETIVRRYHTPIVIYAERMLNDRKRAEDIAQETFLRLIKQLQQERLPALVKPWLYRVAGNLCRDFFRRAEVNQVKMVDCMEEVEQELLGREQAASSTVIQLIERQETRKELIGVLEQLTPLQRQVVILRFYHDFKLEEIAITMELGLSAVKSHLYGALRSLKKKLIENKQNVLKDVMPLEYAVSSLSNNRNQKEGSRNGI